MQVLRGRQKSIYGSQAGGTNSQEESWSVGVVPNEEVIGDQLVCHWSLLQKVFFMNIKYMCNWSPYARA